MLVYLEVVERLGLREAERPDLAIASCGNAALAAAVVAAAGERTLRVFVPVDADPLVLAPARGAGRARHRLPAHPRRSRRPDRAAARSRRSPTARCRSRARATSTGSPSRAARRSPGRSHPPAEPIERLIVQVGGGALASACSHGFREAHALGACEPRPRLDTVQTEAAWPLKRAFDAVVAHAAPGALLYASHHRSEFMWPWEQEPHSVAHGILDDETYDWLAVVDAMLTTGGTALVVGESTLERANALAREATGIAVDPTGSSGLAGLLALREAGGVGDDERVALLFTGVSRSDVNDDKGRRHEELSGTRHPVAQGL